MNNFVRLLSDFMGYYIELRYKVLVLILGCCLSFYTVFSLLIAKVPKFQPLGMIIILFFIYWFDNLHPNAIKVGYPFFWVVLNMGLYHLILVNLQNKFLENGQ